MFAKYININKYLKSPVIPYLVTFIIAVYNLRIGTVMSPDSYQYVAAADNLINFEFNYFLFFEAHTQDLAWTLERFLPIIFPITLIAFLKIIFPLAWMECFVYINIIFVFIAVYLFQRGMLSLKIDNAVIGVCCFLLIFSVDYLTWPRFILTDTIYASLSFLLIYITLSIRNFHLRKISIWLLCLMLLALTRQVAIPILAVSIFLVFGHKIKLNGTVMLIAFLLLFLTSALFYSIYITALMDNTNLSQGVLHLMNFAKSGVVVHDRPDTYIIISNDVFGFLKLFCYRFLYFFNPYASSFSSIHIIFNSFLTVVYFFGLIATIWNWALTTLEQKQYFLKINLFIFAIAIFHSATLIDFDWRYRFPAIILMMFVGAISLQSFVNALKAKYLSQS